jgi:hypothetical protein
MVVQGLAAVGSNGTVTVSKAKADVKDRKAQVNACMSPPSDTSYTLQGTRCPSSTLVASV